LKALLGERPPLSFSTVDRGNLVRNPKVLLTAFREERKVFDAILQLQTQKNFIKF
jgi:hypothetical protein